MQNSIAQHFSTSISLRNQWSLTSSDQRGFLFIEMQPDMEEAGSRGQHSRGIPARLQPVVVCGHP